MRVFIPHVPTRYDRVTQTRVPSFDLNPARQYGEFVCLLDADRTVSADTLPIALSELADGMEDFEPADVLLCVGDVVLIAAAIAYANEVHGKVRLLRWVKNRKSYELVEVSL